MLADPAPGISATPHEENLRYFDVIIAGPGQSPFEGKDSLYFQGERLNMRKLTTINNRWCISFRIILARGLPNGTS